MENEPKKEKGSKGWGWLIGIVIFLLSSGGFNIVIGLIPLIMAGGLGYALYKVAKQKATADDNGIKQALQDRDAMIAEFKEVSGQMTSWIKEQFDDEDDEDDEDTNKDKNGLDAFFDIGKKDVATMLSSLNLEDATKPTKARSNAERFVRVKPEKLSTAEFKEHAMELSDLLSAGIIEKDEYNDRMKELHKQK